MDDRTQVAIVTGAASGIGAATVAALAREGYRVACLDLDAAQADQTARNAGEGHLALGLDISDEAQVIAAFDTVAERLGRIDALATCAGIIDVTPFMDATVASFRRVYDVNVVGTFLCMREAARRMERGGRICTVASVAGLLGGGLSGTAAYAASKGAVLALSRNAARALAPRGIRVNCVAPGPVMTPMIARQFEDSAHRQRIEGMVPLGRSGEAREIAEGIAWLLSPRSSFVDGETLVIDGGLVMH